MDKKIEKEKCIKDTFTFINNICQHGLIENKKIHIKLFDDCIRLYNGDGNWWYSVGSHDAYWMYRGNKEIEVDWFCRRKRVPFEYIEEVWLDNKPLYIDGLECLGHNLYTATFHLPFNFCKSNNITYWGSYSKDEILEKRKFLI